MKIIEEIKQDFPGEKLYQILIKYLMSKGMQAVILYRISSCLYQRGHCQIAKLIKNYSIRITGADIGETAQIGEGLSIGHPVGIVIWGGG